MKTTNSEFNSAQESYNLLIDYLTKKNKDLNSIKIIIDIGAGMPQHYSNSNFFRDKNSKVICIEPNPRFCEMFRQNNFDILEYACTKDDIGTTMFREYMDGHDGLGGSSIIEEIDRWPNVPSKEYEVKALSLNTILNIHHPEVTEIDILDIDTEGNELDVIYGLNMKKYNPKVLIIENIYYEDNGYRDFFNELGYELKACCAHNDIYVLKK